MDITGTVLKVLNREFRLRRQALACFDTVRLRGTLPPVDSIATVPLTSALEARLIFAFTADQGDDALFDALGSSVRRANRCLANVPASESRGPVAPDGIGH